MAEIPTDKLTPEQKDSLPAKEPIMKSIPEPYRSLILLALAGLGMFGGGAAGQGVFGISEEKLDEKLEQQFEQQAKELEAKFALSRERGTVRDVTLETHTEDIRELLKLVRALEREIDKRGPMLTDMKSDIQRIEKQLLELKDK
jgi:hypothetical protein